MAATALTGRKASQAAVHTQPRAASLPSGPTDAQCFAAALRLRVAAAFFAEAERSAAVREADA